jgi:hypothetical protein
MAERIYAGNFVHAGRPDSIKMPLYRPPLDPGSTKSLAYIDETTVAGAEFGVENTWFFPGGPREHRVMETSTESFDRFIGFYANNYEDIRDLCGAEVDISIDGEKHHVTESFVAFVPAGIEAGPITLKNVSKPIFFMIARPCGKGVNKTWRKPA